MRYRPFLIGATLLTTVLMMTAMGAHADSQKLKGANDVSLQAGSAQPAAAAKEIIFRGICDGSAAVKLGSDKILVAYDEENALFVFNITGGRYTAYKELKDLHLKIPDPDKEIDIEAAAVDGQRIWWLGSHSRNKKKKERPNRRMLFATNIPSPDLQDLQIVEGPQDLKNVFEASAEVRQILTKSAWEEAPLNGGVSIEGLATSADGGLLVGFRSPLSGKDGTSGKALVVKIKKKGAKFEVQKAFLLDLNNRGIRDLVKDGDGYMISAGPVDRKEDFALYTWRPGTPPHLKRSLEGLNAEALLDLGTYWLVLSDDGKVKRPDEEAKDGDRICDKIRKKNSQHETHPSVYFRARMIPK